MILYMMNDFHLNYQLINYLELIPVNYIDLHEAYFPGNKKVHTSKLKIIFS